MTVAEYIRLVEARANFIRRFDAETEAFDALVMPTVPMTAPPVAAFARDEDYARLNVKLLRNTSIINFLDRCALSLPIETPGTAPVGLMVVGRHGEDRRLLAIGIGIEIALTNSPRRHRAHGAGHCEEHPARRSNLGGARSDEIASLRSQ